jgi:hypothetical protein
MPAPPLESEPAMVNAVAVIEKHSSPWIDQITRRSSVRPTRLLRCIIA